MPRMFFWLVVWLPTLSHKPQICLLVGGLVAINFIFPFILGCCHHPNWRTHIFQDGVAKNHQAVFQWSRFQKNDHQCIGLRETWQETIDFPIDCGAFRFQFSRIKQSTEIIPHHSTWRIYEVSAECSDHVDPNVDPNLDQFFHSEFFTRTVEQLVIWSFP